MIKILAPGPMSSIQDLGRPGHGLAGISPSGVADPIAFRLANGILRNPPNAAVIEMTLTGGKFQFELDTEIALTGAPMEAELDDGRRLQNWQSHLVRAGQILTLGLASRQCRTYLAVAGGFEVPLFLGSASTHLSSGLGGHHGRRLGEGDSLQVGTVAVARSSYLGRRVNPEILQKISPKKNLRLTLGPDFTKFRANERVMFLEGEYQVTEQANRLGLRLRGPALTAPGEQLTQPVPLGSIQVTPDGQPIILFVEQQTTGGYPQIANVISADQSCLAQLRPGDNVTFERVEISAAIEILKNQNSILDGEAVYLDCPG